MDFFIYILISWNATHDNTKEKNIFRQVSLLLLQTMAYFSHNAVHYKCTN